MGDKILVVDDEEMNRELLSEILGEDGYQVLQAPDGPTAIAEATATSPDLILLDLIMPGMHGFDVARHLKTTPATAEIPIIVVTAVGQFSAKEVALTSGVDDFLTKPVNPTDLRTRVAALLRARHTHWELDRILAYLHELEGDRLRERQIALSKAMGAPWPALAPEGQSIPLLLVSEEGFTLNQYRTVLADHGFRVLAAQSGVEALSLAQSAPIEVAVLDLYLTSPSWLEILQRLLVGDPALPVFMLTGHPMAQRALAALKAGASNILVKGWDHNLTALALHRAARQRREMRGAQEEIQQLHARIRKLEALVST